MPVWGASRVRATASRCRAAARDRPAPKCRGPIRSRRPVEMVSDSVRAGVAAPRAVAPSRRAWWRPEYCSASVLSPWSATIGLTEPWRSSSRRRIVVRMPSKRPSARSSSNWSCGLKTSVGSGARRATREAAGCRPTMKYAVPPALKAKCGSLGSEPTPAAHDSSSASCRRWSSPKSEASKSASSVGRGPRKVAMKEWKPLLAVDVAGERRAAARAARRGRRGRPCRRARRAPRSPRRKTDLAPRQGTRRGSTMSSRARTMSPRTRGQGPSRRAASRVVSSPWCPSSARAAGRLRRRRCFGARIR